MHTRLLVLALTAAVAAPVSAGTGHLLHRGLSWEPLGNASASVPSEFLVLSNIGSSGQDGVRVSIDYAEGLFACLAPGAMPPGAFIEGRRSYVNANGAPVGSATTRVQAFTGALRYTASFGGSGNDVQVFRQGDLVAQLLGHQFAWDAQIQTGVIAQRFHWLDRNRWGVEFDVPFPVMLPDGQVATGDEIRIGPSGAGATADVLQSFDIVAANTGVLTVCDAAMLGFGLHEIRGLGQAQFAHQVDRLTVGNIGATGDDGVTFGGGTGLRAIHNESVCVPGLNASMNLAAGFFVGGAEHPDDLFARFAAAGSRYKLSGNFAAVGATTLSVQFQLQGQVVSSLDGLPFNATLLETAGLPGCDIWDFMSNGIQNSGVSVRLGWATPTTVFLGGDEFVVDTMVLRPDDGDPIDALSSSSRTVANLLEFDVLDVIIAELSCPGDANADGFIDVADLLVILANWGPCPGCGADLDGSGVVNVTDLLIMLANWGACP